MKDWYDKFVDYVIEHWKKKGSIKSKKDEKEAREIIGGMLWLMSEYRLKCLLRTIIDLDDLMERFDRDGK